MVTWAGALVESQQAGDLARVAATHRIKILDGGDAGPGWLLVDVGVNAPQLGPAKFAEGLSRELRTTVIGFFLQSTASIEEVEHWHDGKLVRRLAYSADEGGWITQLGTPQAWEAAYFFADGEGTDEGEDWPSNLGDEISESELERYRRAREAKDALGILDLLSAGSPSSFRRLLRHFGVDAQRPAARFTPPASWKPWLLLGMIVLLLLGALLLGALFPAPRPS